MFWFCSLHTNTSSVILNSLPLLKINMCNQKGVKRKFETIMLTKRSTFLIENSRFSFVK